ncbi:hypothetical protein BLNAU_15379 [Blattamonas nauphoetae]|uniref:Uncharacterized protein n=1 Tax=Blattamonas nauphoetae TaxID=2049346 RepID=A0ABQ9XB54_9EUKA|nr:hypothetical protein BLNAU_15379 [Blattamonas nauphoetae]
MGFRISPVSDRQYFSAKTDRSVPDLLEIQRHDEMRHQQKGQQQPDQLQTKLSESERKCAKLEQEVEILRADKATFLSLITSLQKEKEQLQREKEQIQQEKEQLRSELVNKSRKLEEREKNQALVQQAIQPIATEVPRMKQLLASDVIVAFNPNHFILSGSTVRHISDQWTGCFTRPVSKGIHRLTIKNVGTGGIMIGVCDNAEYPKFLKSQTHNSPKAAMMGNSNGYLWTAGHAGQNTAPQNGQEWSAEADLEKRTLHFFIKDVQQPHYVFNIPVPLVFALDVYTARHDDLIRL